MKYLTALTGDIQTVTYLTLYSIVLLGGSLYSTGDQLLLLLLLLLRLLPTAVKRD